MMNFLQIKTLNNALLLFAGVVVAAMLLQWILAPNYAQKNEMVLSALTDDSQKVLPWQLEELINSGGFSGFLLVDLRSSSEFNHGTLPGAVNVPLANLMEKKNLNIFRKSKKPVLLFSGDESEAAAASFLLLSHGLENVRIIANDYRFVKEKVMEGFSPAAAFNHGENARYDFNRYFRTGGGKDPQSSEKKPVIPKTEVIQAQGGC
jgi:rhodanese-related sulfurtransferase